MYTCICNRISDNEIRNLIETNHISTVQELMKLTPIGNNCGKCINHAKDILNSYMAIDITPYK